MMTQITTFFTNELAVHTTESNIGLVVELAATERSRLVIRLLSFTLAKIFILLLISKPGSVVHLARVKVRCWLFNRQVSIFGKAFWKEFLLSISFRLMDFVRQLKNSLLIFICSNQSSSVFLGSFDFYKGARRGWEKPDIFVKMTISSGKMKSFAVIKYRLLLGSLNLVEDIRVLKCWETIAISKLLAESVFWTVSLLGLLRSK